MVASCQRQLRQVLEILGPSQDIVAGRVIEPQPPTWCERRGWSPYLLALTDEELTRVELDGLASCLEDLPPAPEDLIALGADVRRLTDAVAGQHLALLSSRQEIHVPLRKRSQVAAILRLCEREFTGLSRVVELGAGRGHVSRALSEQLSVPVVGVERQPELVRAAEILARPSGPSTPREPPEFVVGDAARALDLGPADLVLGLHACGSLGDALVRRAAAARARVLLVSCCLQRIGGSRRQPLSETGRDEGLLLPRGALGLTNLWAFSSLRQRDQIVGGRCARHALRRLLQSRGAEVLPGHENRGINRRRFCRGLAAVAPRALERRGWSAPRADEIEHFTELGAREHAQMRRLSLPRNMLGRLIELAVVGDRASFLEDQGYQVRIEPAFSAAVSPRNLAILAAPID